jgi:riboflavin kinase/FMN adenylyltransferase
VPASLVVIGNFDGVHLGHRAILRQAASEARQAGLVPIVLTFHPHPAAVLANRELTVLTTTQRRTELLSRIDPELEVVVEPFTREFASLGAEQFVEELLVKRLAARTVFVGENFRFGRGRAGDIDELERLGRAHGFSARIYSLLRDAAGAYSSSRIRTLVAEGAIEEAERALGRPHMLSGEVVRGDARGRALGVPTANLAGVCEALPPHGVYAVLVDREELDGPQVLGRGMANLGVRPTFDAGASFEVHVLGYSGDLYGARLRVHLVRRLRDEQRFGGLEALRAQLRMDAEAAEAALAARSPDPAARGAWH